MAIAWNEQPLPPIDENQRYSVEEVLKYLRTSRATFYGKVKTGEARLIKDGRRSYVRGRDLICLSLGQPIKE